MDIVEATKSYEAWLGARLPLRDDDLKLKHERMAQAPFMFLRATFYRWMQLWAKHADELTRTPKVLAVGDLHIENFGTWRDLDGRLVWGINDLDEAYPMSYTVDLVRLGVSMAFAIQQGELALHLKDAVEAMLDGYEEAFKKGPRPFVLEEAHPWLRDVAVSELREPTTFWEKLSALPPVKGRLDPSLKRVLDKALPAGFSKARYLRRTAGLGSLGRPRVVAITEWKGGLLAREAKASAPSACLWAEGASYGNTRARRRGKTSEASLSAKLNEQAVRDRDPHWGVFHGWVVRRLAPHCCKIDVSHLPKKRSERELMEAMGFETANLHLGDRAAGAIRRDLSKARRAQIHAGIEEMSELTLLDWKHWRQR